MRTCIQLTIDDQVIHDPFFYLAPYAYGQDNQSGDDWPRLGRNIDLCRRRAVSGVAGSCGSFVSQACSKSSLPVPEEPLASSEHRTLIYICSEVKQRLCNHMLIPSASAARKM